MRPRFRGWRTIAFTAIGLVLGLLLVRESIAGIYRVAGPSDAPTHHWGDVVVVGRCAYDLWLPGIDRPVARIANPSRGDMVLFRVPERGGIGLKRVVAVAGDQVELRDQQLWINGIPAEYLETDARPPAPVASRNRYGAWVGEERIDGDSRSVTFTPSAPLASTEPVRVPAHHVFLLGDNRDASFDSRSFGPLPRDQVLGRVVVNLSRRSPAGRHSRS